MVNNNLPAAEGFQDLNILLNLLMHLFDEQLSQLERKLESSNCCFFKNSTGGSNMNVRRDLPLPPFDAPIGGSGSVNDPHGVVNVGFLRLYELRDQFFFFKSFKFFLGLSTLFTFLGVRCYCCNPSPLPVCPSSEGMGAEASVGRKLSSFAISISGEVMKKVDERCSDSVKISPNGSVSPVRSRGSAYRSNKRSSLSTSASQ